MHMSVSTSYSSRPSFLLRCVGLMTLTLLISACGNEDAGEAGGRPEPQVTIEVIERSSADQLQEYPARVRGAREVEVRTRISGVLQERAHREGADVEKNDVLFRIFPQPLQVLVDQARAARANARAQVAQAERDWERAKQLYERGALSASERDRALTQLDFARAALDEAEARVDEAELNLSYTEVRAPMDGTTSLEVLPEGSVLAVGTLLTTLVEQDTVHVIFALPEKDAAVQRASQLADESLGREVTLELADGSLYPLTGTIDFTSSSVDSATGTITLRAIFDNPDRQLIPGQFVRVRLVLRRFRDEIMVPTEAVGANAEGPMVYVLDQNDVVELRQVVPGPVIGQRQIISEGLSEGDRVVVNGQVAIQPGIPVRVTNPPSADADQVQE